ncbi:endo-1,4-beta-xylanase [Streptomonospora wellingtoniae]|uniref:Beta-xylanase n=1 Tax=Streptomonospora wellingtoniae TaxID=3075544 RepID=A0ABU2KUU4_9ACTN|nr:endo-1,4-beta-xylanase [Streptomonospora sp. DSM 45055]MDT0303054.1 endo-1,4-beta-xylanase [Streptomonospora sp. DSM 45055]
MRPIRFATTALAAAALTVPLAVPAASADTAERHWPPHHSHGKAERLRWAAPHGFRIGTAVAGGGHHLEQDYPDPFTSDRRYRRTLARQFDSVSPENQMKWEYIHPERDEYDFAMADRIVGFAGRHGQAVRGHTLLWHSQNPEWLEEGDFTDTELRSILRDHITTVVGRYRGRIQQWDVANEIFDSEGELRTEENIWLRELGPGVIADAFRWAHRADPHAELYLNDYGVESANAKSDAYYELSRELLADGVPLHGFSAQAHLSLDYPFPGGLEENLRRFDELGLGTAITEIDVRMTLPESGEPTEEQLDTQADYYRQALSACLDVEGCDSFTIWGFTDKYSWVPVFFEGQGAATVMTEDFTRKKSFFAVYDTLKDEKRWPGRPGHGEPR